MKAPILRRQKRVTKIHKNKIVDYYSWIHQKDILSVLSNPSKLNGEVRKYLIEENSYSDSFFKDEFDANLATAGSKVKCC